MSSLVGVERRYPHQTVHASLGFEIAIGKVSGNTERNAFNAGLFSGLMVDYFRRVAMSFRPAKIHSHEHLGPILAFGASGAGMNGNNRIVAIDFTGKQELKFYLVDFLFERFDFEREFIQKQFSIILTEYIQRFLKVVHFLNGVFYRVKSIGELRFLFLQFL